MARFWSSAQLTHLGGVLPRREISAEGPCPSRCALALVVLSVLQSGCAATLPVGTLSVTEVELEGTEAVSEEAIKQCIATQPRKRFGFVLGEAVPDGCGQPPFDAARIPVTFWTWPWTPRLAYDPAIFERDLERIERFYRARGYYDARVLDSQVEQRASDHTVNIRIRVAEGKPVRVRRVAIDGIEYLTADLQRQLRATLSIEPGEPFDEYWYDASKKSLEDALGEASFARAEVSGDVQLSREQRWADVTFTVEPGPPCRFGRVYLEGYEDLPPRPIWGAAGMDEGSPFSLSALADARSAVYALGPFASVEVVPIISADSDIVDVLVKVVPGRRTRLAFGLGMEVGGNLSQGTADAGDSFAQWDLHLVGRFEHRNFLGGMRRLQIEDRPRLIFDDPFPRTTRPHAGNTLSVDFRQPAFLEARTALRANLRWELGPDPYGGRFFRSQMTAGVGPERSLFGGILRLASSVDAHIFQEIADVEDGPYPDYSAVYMQHTAELELRDEPTAPTEGLYASLSFIHAGYLLPGDWNYLRVVPEVRGYVPLPLGIVLAMRAGIGVMEVTKTYIREPDEDSGGFVDRLRRFGPLIHRLRGGGHNSVRGYRPNTLGDVVQDNGRLDSGGTREWEVNFELRVPLSGSFGTVFFLDLGDVSQAKRFRWNYPQTTLGFGLRYHTLVGPLRLDVGFAPPALQVLGEDERIRTGVSQATIFDRWAGTIHFTIGEAF